MLYDFSTHILVSDSFWVSTVFVCGVRTRPESVPFHVSVQLSNTVIKGYYFSSVASFASGCLFHWSVFFNCLGYCGFTKSFEMRKSVLSNVVVLQGCFGLRQYKILKFQNHFVSFWRKKKAAEVLRRVMLYLCVSSGTWATILVAFLCCVKITCSSQLIWRVHGFRGFDHAQSALSLLSLWRGGLSGALRGESVERKLAPCGSWDGSLGPNVPWKHGWPTSQ